MPSDAREGCREASRDPRRIPKSRDGAYVGAMTDTPEFLVQCATAEEADRALGLGFAVETTRVVAAEFGAPHRTMPNSWIQSKTSWSRTFGPTATTARRKAARSAGSRERRAQVRAPPRRGRCGGQERGVLPQGGGPVDLSDRGWHGQLDAGLAAGREGHAAQRGHRQGLPRRQLGLAGQRIQALRDDSREVYRASQDAQVMSDYVLDRAREKGAARGQAAAGPAPSGAARFSQALPPGGGRTELLAGPRQDQGDRPRLDLGLGAFRVRR